LRSIGAQFESNSAFNKTFQNIQYGSEVKTPCNRKLHEHYIIKWANFDTSSHTTGQALPPNLAHDFAHALSQILYKS
jgi:hypothetical protein